MRLILTTCLVSLLFAPLAVADSPVRARDLGIPLDGTPASSSTARHRICRPLRNSGGAPWAWR